MQYNRNGVQVRQSQPVRALKKLTKTITIDSRDRDPTKFVRVPGGAVGPYSDPGDYVVYLPRQYAQITGITLKNAVIQAPTAQQAGEGAVGFAKADTYIFVCIEGLNAIDETAPGADRAGFANTVFAKIQNYNNTTAGGANTTTTLFWNDQTYDHQIVKFNPPISNLDRLHVTIRRHPPITSIGAGITSGLAPLNAPIVFGIGENSFTFELEYLDNVFEDVSSFETFLPAVAC
jgi:hypothetical protein